VTTFVSIVIFLVSATWCAERLVRARRAVAALAPVPTLVASWVALLALRTPTAGRALLAFVLVDLAVLAISVLGVLRMLGGFEPVSGEDDDGWDDGHDVPVPGPHPHGPRRVRALRRGRQVSALRRSARGSASRGSSRSSSGRSATTRS
jgi:hypothetical protein